jgi:DNA integrity scanning protein DisA with diadenylate cyclase activity
MVLFWYHYFYTFIYLFQYRNINNIMNFIIFNAILFSISYIIDYIAVDWFDMVEWSMNYINYLLFINFPISTILLLHQ